MNQQEKEILCVLEAYKKAIHTQAAEDFYPIWANGCKTSLISLSNCYNGTDTIYHDFLLNRIQAAYTRIDLIAKEIKIEILNESCAVVIFSYYTDCIRRDTGEPYGISGLETQVYVKESDGWKLAHVQYAKDEHA